MSLPSFPSIYANRTCDRAPVWSLYAGSFHVLQCADGVGGSSTLGSVGRSVRGNYYVANVKVPGTREQHGAFEVLVGRFPDLAKARAAVMQGALLRHADPVAFDKAARRADRANEPLILADLLPLAA